MTTERLTSLAFFARLRWIKGGEPLLPHIEGYRRRLFAQALDSFDESDRPLFNLILTGRGKKKWKSADLVLAALFALIDTSPHGNQCYLLANDQDQASDDLKLAKHLIAANPVFLEWLKPPKQTVIERRDGTGFLEVLPAQDAVGAHGKTFRFAGLMGAVFRKDPVVQFPDRLGGHLEDVTLADDPFTAFALKLLEEILVVGRAGRPRGYAASRHRARAAVLGTVRGGTDRQLEYGERQWQ